MLGLCAWAWLPPSRAPVRAQSSLECTINEELVEPCVADGTYCVWIGRLQDSELDPMVRLSGRIGQFHGNEGYSRA